jgi:hypothetical protein
MCADTNTPWNFAAADRDLPGVKQAVDASDGSNHAAIARRESAVARGADVGLAEAAERPGLFDQFFREA